MIGYLKTVEEKVGYTQISTKLTVLVPKAPRHDVYGGIPHSEDKTWSPDERRLVSYP